MASGYSWEQHITNGEVYGDLLKISDKKSGLDASALQVTAIDIQSSLPSYSVWEPTYGRMYPLRSSKTK